jgi:hypothetical protein
MEKKIIFAMSRLSAAIIGLTFCMNFSYAQERERTILYRINAGGYEVEANNIGDPVWRSDVTTSPTEYSNWSETDNNVYTTNAAITLHSSVPAGTPTSIFQFERVNGNYNVPSLTWTFPVEAETEIEVRLYFSEIFFDATGSRIFDIKINKILVYDNLDIYSEVGKHVGIMKTFQTTSDGNIVIDLERVKQHPKINGIEIIALGPEEETETEPEITSLLHSKGKNHQLELFPNPANNYITLKSHHLNLNNCEFSILDHTGARHAANIVSQFSDEAIINTSALENGLYYIQATSLDNMQGFKFIKQ